MASSTTLLSILSSALPLPTTIVDPSIVGPLLAFEAYCLNPPSDSCHYGPCPNPDVTGVGQQVSIYIASFMFIIALVYCQELVRPMLYAHLGLIYSLLIASCASISRGELTQNDGVFVLVTVASPASFSLWLLTLWSLWHPNQFPVRKSKSKSIEVPLLKILSLGSLAFEIIMICLIFLLPSRSYFSQPACDRLFGGKTWNELLWEMPYLVQAMWLVIIISLIGGCALKKTTRRKADFRTSTMSKWGQWENTAQADVVTWTEISLVKDPVIALPKSSKTLSTILAIIQLCAMPNVGFFVNQSFFVFLLLLWARHMDRSLNKDRCFGSNLIVLAGFFLVLNSILSSNFPSSSDSVLAYVSLTISWQRFCFPGAVNYEVWRNRILYLAGLGVALSCSSFAWAMTPATLGTSMDGKKSFSALKPQPLLLNTFMLPLWILAWLATSIWPAGKQLSYSQMWKFTMSRAHILKAGILVIAPNGLWIQSSIASNSTRSTNMTFGQIFALVVSSASVASLINVARHIDTKVWKAFFLSEPFSTSQDDVLPLYSHIGTCTSRNPRVTNS